ncbi:MAG: hypothetical protein PVG66_09140 [Chromatiales bacterium]|jgi:hypothetical protein
MQSLRRLRQLDTKLADWLACDWDIAAADQRELLAGSLRQRQLKSCLEQLKQTGQSKVLLAGEFKQLARLLNSSELFSLDIAGVYCPDIETPAPLPVYQDNSRVAEPLAALSAQMDLPLINLGLEPETLAGIAITQRFDVFWSANTAPADLVTNSLAHKRDAAFEFHRDNIDAVYVPGKTVLFAATIEYFNFLRISEELRARGYRTVFVSLYTSSQQHKTAAFDYSCSADGDLELFYSLLNSHAYRVVHFQGWMCNHEYAAAAVRLVQSPIVVDINDIPHFFLQPDHFDAVFGEQVFQREHYCLQVIAENADALVANCSAEYLQKFVEVLDAKALPELRPFHAWPSPSHFFHAPTDNKYKIVFPGTLLPSNFPADAFDDGQLITMIRNYLLPQGLAYAVFLNPFSGGRLDNRYWDYQTLAKLEPDFEVFEGVSSNAVVEQISHMGFGGMFYLFGDHFKVMMEHYHSILPTKFFTMLEAGLPIIYNEEFHYMHELVSDYRLGFAVSQDDIRQGRIREKIDACDYEQLKQNVLRFREDYSMSRKIGDLLQVYDHATRQRSAS